MLNTLQQISFYAYTFPVNLRIFTIKFKGCKNVNILELVSAVTQRINKSLFVQGTT